jgi:MerR family transcriptional regulator, copper efflux regulator
MQTLRIGDVARLADIERKMAELKRVRRGLQNLVAACPGHGELDQCPIVAALSTEETV